jgi:hypothetical protein
MARDLRENEIIPGLFAHQKRAMLAQASEAANSYLDLRVRRSPELTEVQKDEIWQGEYNDKLDEAIEAFEAAQLEKEEEDD